MTLLPNRVSNLVGNITGNLNHKNSLAREKLAFQLFNKHGGVRNLSRYLTINGSTVEASYRFFGGDADTTSWIEENGGVTCARVAVATEPTYNAGSPFHGGPLDDSVKFNGSDYFKDSSNTACQVGTEDIVFELIFKGIDSVEYLVSTLGANGYYILGNTSGDGNMSLYLNDDDENIKIDSAAGSVPLGVWVHALIFVNRDEASLDGSKIYINGVVSGPGFDFSTAEKTLDSTTFSIGARATGVSPFTSNIAYCAMWKRASWHQAGAAGPAEWATIAATRYARLTRTMPDFAKGTRLSTTSSRAFSAYLDKLESGRTVRKLYLVGDNHIRTCSRLDANGEYFEGALIEPQATNNLTYSEQADHANWSKTNATIDANAAVAPNGETTADGIIASVDNNYHSIGQIVAHTVGNNVLSCFAKKADKDWFVLQVVSIGYVYFDLSNGAVGTESSATGYIEPWGNGWYRCMISYTGDGAGHSCLFIPAEADGDVIFIGDAATVNTYVWGMQHETTGLGYATSYVPTTSASATRLKDQLAYAGGANIGGEDIGRGTIACDVLAQSYDLLSSRYLFNVNDGGAAADSISGYIDATGDKFSVATAATAGNAGASSVTDDIVDNTINKLKISYQADFLVPSVNTVSGTADTSCDMPDGLDVIDIGQKEDGTLQAACLIRNVRIFNDPDIDDPEV